MAAIENNIQELPHHKTFDADGLFAHLRNRVIHRDDEVVKFRIPTGSTLIHGIKKRFPEREMAPSESDATIVTLYGESATQYYMAEAMLMAKYKLLAGR